MRATKEKTPGVHRSDTRGDEAPEALDVDVRGVEKKFGEVFALRGVDLDVKKGTFVTLLGPSGCGKTTLLRIIAGLETATSGQVHISGRAMSAKVPPHKRPVSLVFQNLALFPHLSVRQNIAFPMQMRKVPRREINAKVDEYLELIQMSGFGSRSVDELSGGQRQRVALARSMAHEPDVLLLDEPLSALDMKLRKRMQVELTRFQKRLGTTFIYVTHDQEEALVMSDRIAVFSEGRIEQYDRPLEIYRNPASAFVADFVGESNLFDATLLHEAGSYVLDAPGFRMPLPEPSRATPGHVVCSLRPEYISVHDPDQAEDRVADHMYAEATIREVLFYGSDTKVVAETGGQQLTARSPFARRGKTLISGQRAILSWPRTAVTLLPPPESEALHA
jgi:ABC-type Fe3+/spermidine/putrescine transport system ATPase subunit